MLIITRHKGQRIVLGGEVEVIVTEISRSGVKLGIVAPSSLTFLRGEVRDAVESANRDAALSQIADPDALLTQASSGHPAPEPHSPLPLAPPASNAPCKHVKP